MRFILLALALSVSLGCSHLHRPPAQGTGATAPQVPPGIPPETSQLLLVVGVAGSPEARLYALERPAGEWRLFLGPLTAAVGRNGFAKRGEKREGDGRSPSGLFPLESVFGYAPSAATGMPYRQATEDDIWVDDPDSPQYNRWVRKGESAAASYEVMKLPDLRYRHGVVIGYNRNPVVQGAGSAIFLHAWLERGRSTAGCVALQEEDLVRLIAWLDPARQPMMAMGTGGDLYPP